MDNDDIFMIGYGGWARIFQHAAGDKYNYRQPFEDAFEGGTLLQVTSANVTRTTNIPELHSYYLPFKESASNSAKSPMLAGRGTYTFSGEISFELTAGTLRNFLNPPFFERNSFFSMAFYDGQNVCAVTNCVWSSCTITCAPGSLVTVSLSYQSNNGYMDDIQVMPWDGDGLQYDENDLLIPYWTCGHAGFQSFTLTFDRSVTPVFLNGNLNVASYLRPGLVTVNLQVEALEFIESWSNLDFIPIMFGSGKDSWKQINLNNSILQSSSYNMSSMSDTGAKTYVWRSLSSNPQNPVFTVTWGETPLSSSSSSSSSGGN